jgi:hypothetical protein
MYKILVKCKTLILILLHTKVVICVKSYLSMHAPTLVVYIFTCL